MHPKFGEGRGGCGYAPSAARDCNRQCVWSYCVVSAGVIDEDAVMLTSRTMRPGDGFLHEVRLVAPLLRRHDRTESQAVKAPATTSESYPAPNYNIHVLIGTQGLPWTYNPMGVNGIQTGFVSLAGCTQADHTMPTAHKIDAFRQRYDTV